MLAQRKLQAALRGRKDSKLQACMALAFVIIWLVNQQPPCSCTSFKAHTIWAAYDELIWGYIDAACSPQLAPDSPGNCQACITGYSHQLYSVGALVLGALPISLNLPIPASII